MLQIRRQRGALAPNHSVTVVKENYMGIFGMSEKDLEKLYKDALSCENDDPKMEKLLLKAADNKHVPSQYLLGMFYLKGDPAIFKKDISKGIGFLQKAAEKGHDGAQYELGKCYFTGTGVTEDSAKAIEWFKKSAEQDNEDAIGVLKKLKIM